MGGQNKTFEELADYLGEQNAEKLVELCVGQRIHVPVRWTPTCATAFLGEKLGCALSEAFAREKLEIPRKTHDTNVRNLQVQRLWDEGKSNNEIAVELGYTERHARRWTCKVRYRGLPQFAERDRIIREGYDNLMPLKQIAAQAQCSAEVAKRLVFRMGLFEAMIASRKDAICVANEVGMSKSQAQHHAKCSADVLQAVTKRFDLFWGKNRRKKIAVHGTKPRAPVALPSPLSAHGSLSRQKRN